MTGPQKALAGALLAFVPPVLGLTLPGGLVGGSVSLEFDDIFLATLPWSLSVALIAWLWLAWEESDGKKFAASVAVLVVGAVLALPLAKPDYEVSSNQADSPFYYVAATAGPSAIAQGGRVAAHNPRATFFVGAVGAAAFVLFAYAMLYGFPLWLAGLACGAYFGYLLYNGTASAKAPPPAGG